MPHIEAGSAFRFSKMRDPVADPTKVKNPSCDQDYARFVGATNYLVGIMGAVN